MTNVACFCGCAYSFDGGEGPCPKCGAVAVVGTKAIHKTSGNNEQSEPDAAAAGASLPAQSPVPSSGRTHGKPSGRCPDHFNSHNRPAKAAGLSHADAARPADTATADWRQECLAL